MNKFFTLSSIISKIIFGVILVIVFSVVFGPVIYAEFTRQDGPAGEAYGYGYGYGVGYGVDNGSYRIGGSDGDIYEYGYGYGRRIVQLTIADPTLTLTKPYDGNLSATVTAGVLSGVFSPDIITVSAVASYDTASVGGNKTITVVYTIDDGLDSWKYIAPVDYVVSNGVIIPPVGGSGGSTYVPPVTPATPATPATPGTEIPGCGNRTTGFSTSTGVSCVGNTSTTPATPATPASSSGEHRTYFDFGTKTLRNGSTGEAVKELQRFLNQVLNLGLVVDGRLGPKTIAVIKKWQKDNGLVADGLVGPKTKAMMNASVQ